MELKFASKTIIESYFFAANLPIDHLFQATFATFSGLCNI